MKQAMPPKRKLTDTAKALLFAGLEEAFEKNWPTVHISDPARKRRAWNSLARWANLFVRRLHSLIPRGHTACLIETLQQYKRFSPQEICTVLTILGRMAGSLYCARRDYFGDGPMHPYYVACMESLMWMVATLHQPQYRAFSDLVTVLGRHLGKAKP